MRRLLNTAIGLDWSDRIHEPETWQQILDIDDGRVWRAHGAQRELMTRTY